MSFRTVPIAATLAGSIGLLTASFGSASADALLLDEFKGDKLSSHWEVLNEDPDSYIVEDDKLLIIGASHGHLKSANVPNIIRLKAAPPKGDWVATVKFTMPYQTGRETPFLAIYEDKDNHLAATTNAWSYYGGTRGARMYLSGWKRTKGKESSFGKVIWGGAKGKVFTADKAPNPIYLRITKKGRTYTPAYRLEGMKQTEWNQHEKLTVLRPKGSLAIGIFQSEKVKGETPMSIDWFKIEALK